MTLCNENTFEISILETLQNFQIDSINSLDYFLLKQKVENNTDSLKSFILSLLTDIEEIQDCINNLVIEKENIQNELTFTNEANNQLQTTVKNYDEEVQSLKTKKNKALHKHLENLYSICLNVNKKLTEKDKTK